MTSLKVEKMKCGGCASAVEGAIKALDSSAEVKVNLAAKTVEINNTSVNPSILAEAISKAGYPAST